MSSWCGGLINFLVDECYWYWVFIEYGEQYCLMYCFVVQNVGGGFGQVVCVEIWYYVQIC